MNLIEFQLKYSNEEACIKDLETRRWGENNAICPFCKSNHFCKHNTRHIYTCMDCKKQYSVRMGTIFESSRLPLNKWYLAIYLFTSLKKGISSHQLSKYLSITQKSAWFMLQRIREVMKNDNNDKFTGTTEIDEAYLGGSETNKHADTEDNQGKTAYKINTNSIEGFWSQLKRGIDGIYHWANNKHIQRYVNEFCYRYNNKAISDIDKFANWFSRFEGRRLYYKVLVG